MACLLAGGCGHRKKGPPPPPPPAVAPPLTALVSAKKMHWSLPDAQGRKMWELDAARGTGSATARLAQLEDVRCKIYRDGKPAMDAVAPHVDADFVGKRLKLHGGVTARTVDGGRSFESECVIFTSKEDKSTLVEAQGGVRTNIDGTIVTGTRLVTDPALEQGQVMDGRQAK